MNYYFLLEDEKSFLSILPIWLDFMEFGCTRVQQLSDVCSNNYVLESGHGITRLETETIFKTIDTLIDSPDIIDKLVIIADAEEIGFQERKTRIREKINNYYSSIELPCDIEIFVCNRCIETWLLGCKGISNYQTENIPIELSAHYDFYDIENNNPELMGKPLTHNSTVATYHFQYLHDMLLDISLKEHKRALSYRKNKVGCTIYPKYFEGMLKRATTTTDISSFKEFYDFIIAESKNNN